MAVGAYASVLALMRALDNALLPCRSRLLPDKSQIQTLQEKVGLLQESLELLNPSRDDNSTIRQIREVVREADDLIDRYVVDQLRGGESRLRRSSFCKEIQVLIQRIESVNQELIITMDKNHGGLLPPPNNNPSHHAGTSRVQVDSRGKKTTLVGFEDVFLKIMEDLTHGNRSRQIITILGMGGIGKTTLARHIYDHPIIVQHFDIRIWLTISQEFDVREILLVCLKSYGGIRGDYRDEELGERLYKTLFGRRYLIVMDDVWSTQAWERIGRFFPRDDNGIRILITTRVPDVASYFGANNIYNLKLLDEDTSWKLFCQKVFGHSTCPPELEEIGKNIVTGCNGIPLAIVVVAASVSEFGFVRELWEAFAEKMESSLDLENLMGILSLSYNNLPIHLKLCFISMGEFPQDSRIEVSRLVELWVSVGIVRPARNRIAEKVARQCIEDLIGRNLVTAVEQGSRGNIKTCIIHGSLREIGIKESQGESFLSVPKVQEISYSSLKPKNSCFLCGNNGACYRIPLREVLIGSLSTALMNPMVCDACDTRIDGSRSIRLIEKLHDQRVEIPQMTKLRSLSIGDRFRFNSKQIVFASPSSVSLLWNLQRLCFHVSGHEGSMILSKLWEMPQLIYVHLLRHVLPDPVEDANATVVLQHLRTLTLVKNLRFTAEVVRRIPNLVKLNVVYDPDSREGEELNCSYYSLENLERLKNLQSLKLACRRRSFDIRDISMVISLKALSFPQSLEKLTLMDCKLAWKDMSVLGSLPNLEVLKLNRDAFVGEEWCTGEGEFQTLQYLKLEDLDLISWTADSSAFPDLRKLVLVGLCQIEKIPSLLGELPLMETIHASFCTEYVVKKVKKIKDLQWSSGNEGLHCVLEED